MPTQASDPRVWCGSPNDTYQNPDRPHDGHRPDHPATWSVSMTDQIDMNRLGMTDPDP